MASSPKQSAVEKGNGKGLESDQQLPITLKRTGAIAGERGSSSGAPDPPNCIFKIPAFLKHNKHNSYGYQPTIVSIGPYHKKKRQLKLLEIKEEFKNLFITKAGDDVTENTLLKAVELTRRDIERSYSSPFGVDDHTDLIPTMVLDGCFILTFFLTIAGIFGKEHANFSMPWAMPSIQRDLLLLENQIPLFVLETLLKTGNFRSKRKESLDLNKLAFEFFKGSFKNHKNSWEEHQKQSGVPLNPKHLLDFIRQTFKTNNASSQTNVTIPPEPSNVSSPTQGNNASTQPQTNSVRLTLSANKLLDFIRQTFKTNNASSQTNVTIPPEPSNVSSPTQGNNASTQPQTNSVRLTLSANKLLSRGIKFEVKKNAASFLDISFKNGVLKIPEIIMDDFLSVVMLNCIAFEQLYANASTEITNYTMFMGCLVNSKRDVSYFVEKGIIQNYLGTEDDLSLFFKRVLNDYVVDIERSYLADAIKDVDTYSSNRWNVGWATFRQAFLGSPWIFASKVAALAILLLTIAQVVLAAIAL